MKNEIDKSGKILLLVLAILCSFLVVIYTGMDQNVADDPVSISPGDYTYSIRYAEDHISRVMSSFHIPCFGFAMVDDQKVVHQTLKGYLDIQKKMQAYPDTMFRACSISKVFTAIEIMRLYEEGLVDIDLPLSRYVPYFSIQSRFDEDEPITLRKLMAHRAGLPRNSCLLPWHRDVEPHVLKDVVSSLKYSHMAYPPGHRYKYSNVAFDILGHVVEKRRKQIFSRYMDLDVLPAMGMKNSSFDPSSEDIARTATGYRYRNGVIIPYSPYRASQIASSSLHTSVPDMCEFLRFIFRGGETEKGQVIKEESLEMMFHSQYSWPGDPHENGLAWRTDTIRTGELTVFHHGICQGTQSLVALMPERRLGVVLFCTSSDPDDSALIQFGFEILRLMLRTRYGITGSSWKLNIETGHQIEVAKPIRYEGIYCLDGETIKVFVESDDLKVKIEEGEMTLLPVGEEKFVISSGNERIRERYGDIEVRFFQDTLNHNWMIHIFRGGVYRGTAVPCPVLDGDSALNWEILEGKYGASPRFISGFTADRGVGWAEIMLKDRILFIPSHRAVLKPISSTELVILGGLFDGETMLYDPDTGNIAWQDVVYSREEPSSP